MAEYIEREALVSELKENHEFIMNHPEIRKQTKWREALCYNRTLKAVYNQPAADVVEVVHGHNKTSMHPVDEFLCSVCGFCCADYTETKYDEDGDYTYSCECEFDYCPKCGAKMDGERRREE